MIKNIVFDLGNVLISFKPAEYLKSKDYNPHQQELILSDIFRSREWLLIDNGDITTEEAIERIASVSELKTDLIARIFKNRMDLFSPMSNNVKILPEIKKRGFKLYYLSNFPGDVFPEVINENPFFKYFDGGIVSAFVRCSKPDHHIYKLLFNTYRIDPAESLYIDDLEINVKSAVSLGMKGFVTHGSENISDLIETFL